MTEGNRKVLAQSLYLWIATGFVIAFNAAAAMSNSAIAVYAALAMTGVVALAGIGFGIWAGFTVTKERRKA